MTTPKSYHYNISTHKNSPFLRGVSSVFDIKGSIHIYKIMGNSSTTDFDAIMSDWLAVGDDIRSAIAKNKPLFNEKKKTEKAIK